MRRGYTAAPKPVAPVVTEVPKEEAPKERSGAELYAIVMGKISKGETVMDTKGKPVSIHSADHSYVFVYPERRGNGDRSRCKAVNIHEFCEEMKWTS